MHLNYNESAEKEIQLFKAIDSRISTLKEVGKLPDHLQGCTALSVKEIFQTKWALNKKAAKLFIKQAAGSYADAAIRLWTEDGVRTAARDNDFGMNVGV